ncbi:hypothetical protein [Thalassospira povalilytica]|uniref:hypothetical protein n=1 Tax=Thalassospira povalilytica TaxID=732237 RepID=UPI001D19472E|nr:hypothetical protein [Thalassospira povalilytica]MCC4239870.1 hypothetical protein [Thalassospira povalilytica]
MTKGDLKPYLAAIDEIMERNRDNPAWGIATQRWNALVHHCQSIVEAYLNGKAIVKFKVQAAREVIRLYEHVEALEVIRTVCAIYLMAEHRPRTFLSDQAFIHQLVRRCRGLTDANAGIWYDQTTGKAKRVYRDLPRRTVSFLGQMITDTLGAISLSVARKDRRTREHQNQQRENLKNALEELQ